MNRLIGANVALRKKLKTARENRSLWRKAATNTAKRNESLLVRIGQAKAEIKELKAAAKTSKKTIENLFSQLRRIDRHGSHNS
jgi:chromosome segregation ATPase